MTASRLVLRLLLVPIGLFMAILTAVLIALFGVAGDGGLFAAVRDGYPLEEIALATLPALFFVGPALFAVGLVAALVAEAMSIRSWMFYALVGGATGFFAGRLLGIGPDLALSAETAVGAGLAAGIVYWAVAGRTAGAERPAV